MKIRERLCYMMLGSALVFIGMLFSSMSPLTAENDGIGEVVCGKFPVVDENGEVIRLTSDEVGGLVKVGEYGGLI